MITGAPGTGKSSIVRQLEALGHLCYHEVIRTMTLEAKKEGDPSSFVTNPLAFVADPYRFNRLLLEGRMKDHRMGSKENHPLTFYDRGIPDVLAYMDFFGQSYGQDFVSACEEHRYDLVLLLPPWEDIYVSDNERLESFDEAVKIHRFIETTYRRFGYDPVPVPEGTVEERAATILREINRKIIP